LSAAIGGPDLTGVGWALGVDRVLLALKAENPGRWDEPATAGRLDVFVVPIGPAARRRALVLARDLRDAAVRVDLAWGGKGLKGAMKAADRSGARYALVLGEQELATGTVQLKDMASGQQHVVPLDIDAMVAAVSVAA